MENQHRKIKGYRELSGEEIALMNKVKELGINLQEFVNTLERYQATGNAIFYLDTGERLMIDYDWLQQGKKYMQIGLMCITRSIAKPEFF
jgi:hypothetical protein